MSVLACVAGLNAVDHGEELRHGRVQVLPARDTTPPGWAASGPWPLRACISGGRTGRARGKQRARAGRRRRPAGARAGTCAPLPPALRSRRAAGGSAGGRRSSPSAWRLRSAQWGHRRPIDRKRKGPRNRSGSDGGTGARATRATADCQGAGRLEERENTRGGGQERRGMGEGAWTQLAYALVAHSASPSWQENLTPATGLAPPSLASDCEGSRGRVLIKEGK